jgi:prepilin-type N-terminal cleavage/methylation domain-containing protein
MNAVIKQNKNNGFTMIELLIVVSIMVILGVIFTNILIDALRGRNKVNAINQVKQNGQVVLDQLSNEIRNADFIVCVERFGGGNGSKDTIVITNGGVYTQFRLVPPLPVGLPTANGYIQKGIINSDALSLNNNTPSNLCTQTTFLNTDFNQHLTDADTKNGVSVFYTPKTVGVENVFEQNGDNITIRFNASAGVSAGSAYDVTVAEGGIPFSTSVQVRGIAR